MANVPTSSKYPSNIHSTDTVSEPIIIAMAKCNSQKFYIKIKGWSFELIKEDFGLAVVLYDFVIVLIFMYFIYFLESNQSEFIDEFKDQTIEMDDFAVALDGIPPDHYYHHDEHVLRAYIWRYAEEVMIDQYKLNAMSDRQPKWYNLPQLHVADVNFSKKTNRDIDILLELSKLRKKS